MQINPESSLRGTINHLMDEVGAQKRFAAQERKHAAGRRVQPVNRAFGNVRSNSFHTIVESSTILAVQVARPLREQIGNDGVKNSRQDSRLQVGDKPGAQSAGCKELSKRSDTDRRCGVPE